MDVGERVRVPRATGSEADSGLLAHRAVHAVRAHQISGSHPLAAREYGGHARAILLERLEFAWSPHPNPKFAEPLDQYGFSHGLTDQERERECWWGIDRTAPP